MEREPKKTRQRRIKSPFELAQDEFARNEQASRPREIAGVEMDWSQTLSNPQSKDLRGRLIGLLRVWALSGRLKTKQGRVYYVWRCRCTRCGSDVDFTALDLTIHKRVDCGNCTPVPTASPVVDPDTGESMVPTEDPAFGFARDHLLAYACFQWAGYEPAHHHRLIAAYLEKVERGEIKRLMIWQPPRSGKLLADSTPILTTEGLKRHGELKAGDFVFDIVGKPTKVIAVSDKQPATLQVHFSNGEMIKCHERHEWGVVYADHEKIEISYSVFETAYIRDKLASGVKFSLPDTMLRPVRSESIWILSVQKCEPELGHCIQVECSDGLYLVGRTMIPTHNSMLVSEYFPAWYLGKNPDKRVICASYGQELASDFGRKVRNQLADPLYQKIFRGPKLSDDSAAVDKFNMGSPNVGEYFAVGVGGALTGRGANCLTGNTLILTDLGLIPIDSLVKNHYNARIVAYDHDHSRLEFANFVAGQVSFSKTIIEMTTKGGKTVCATPDHLFYHVRRAEYLPIVEFKNGDLVKCLFLEHDVVDSVRATPMHANVYDIQVEKYHNFFANGILNHNCLIIDDPTKSREDSDSFAHQKRLQDWYTSVAYTRLMDDGAIIICQTRWNVNDLSGWLLKEHAHEGWVVINLPAINKRGEALWPERYPLEQLLKIKQTLPARDWESLYQQKPFIEEGGIFKKSWWKQWPENKPFPECTFILQSYDTAYSEKDEKTNSYSARTTWGVFQRPDDEVPNLILLESWEDRVDYPDLKKEALRSFNEYQPDKVLIEKKASGQSLLQDLRRSGLPITAWTPDKDKTTRAYAAQSLFENGRVYYPSRRWAEDTVDKIARFIPYGTGNDLADTVSQAILWLQRSWILIHSDQKEDDEEDDDDMPGNVVKFKKRKGSAYG